MQTLLPTAELKLQFANASAPPVVLGLVPPINFWSLCPYGNIDYNYTTDWYLEEKKRENR